MFDFNQINGRKNGKLWKIELSSFLNLTLINMEEGKTQLGKPGSRWENNTRRIYI